MPDGNISTSSVLRRNMTASQLPLSPLTHEGILDYRDKQMNDFYRLSNADPREIKEIGYPIEELFLPTWQYTDKGERLRRQYTLAEESIKARKEGVVRDRWEEQYGLPERFYKPHPAHRQDPGPGKHRLRQWGATRYRDFPGYPPGHAFHAMAPGPERSDLMMGRTYRDLNRHRQAPVQDRGGGGGW